jgi:type III secretory pathway component EscU
MAKSALETNPLIILIAGPYSSGTNNDPELIAKNLERLEQVSLRVYEAGHIPLIGEWVALPVARQAGSTQVGDAVSERYLYPVAKRLIQRCDAVLRIEGRSKGADEDVRLARQRGLPIYFNIEEVPVVSAALL